MCGRYYIPPEDDDSGFLELLEQLRQKFKDSPLLPEMRLGEIYPTNIVPIVASGAPALMKWGFSRIDGKGQIINARLETAAEKPMFKGSYERRRCLVPAGYYFEWLKDGAIKQKYAIGTGAPITFAGLYQSEQGSPLPQFVILTRPAAPGIAFIHDRMPVIVPEYVRKKWLAEAVDTRELLAVSDVGMKYREAG
jgi:putative SOS response-associated peptidase YedK